MASPFQFSIRSLLAGVTIVAIGIAALLNANAWWEAAVWGASLFVLACAVALIIYRRDDRRAFWTGFGIFGWLYLFVLVYSWMPYANSQYSRTDPLAQSSLITTRLTRLAYDSLLPASRTQPAIVAPVGSTSTGTYYFGTALNSDLEVVAVDVSAPASGAKPINVNSLSGLTGPLTSVTGTVTMSNPAYVPTTSFVHVAHALWLLLIAAVGGKACQIIYRTRPKETQP